jgi:hypothetical protein
VDRACVVRGDGRADLTSRGAARRGAALWRLRPLLVEPRGCLVSLEPATTICSDGLEGVDHNLLCPAVRGWRPAWSRSNLPPRRPPATPDLLHWMQAANGLRHWENTPSVQWSVFQLHQSPARPSLTARPPRPDGRPDLPRRGRQAHRRPSVGRSTADAKERAGRWLSLAVWFTHGVVVGPW